MNMYSKQDIKNKAVFSELSILDLSGLTSGGIYQSCSRTINHAAAWTRMQIAIWPSNGVRTFLETRSAVGRFLLRTGNGPDQPTIG